MMLPYILNLIGNKEMWLISTYGASLSYKIELSNEKRTNFLVVQVILMVMALASGREN